jgi:hypothetical protein
MVELTKLEISSGHSGSVVRDRGAVLCVVIPAMGLATEWYRQGGVGISMTDRRLVGRSSCQA